MKTKNILLAYRRLGKISVRTGMNERKENDDYFVLPVWRPRIIARTTKNEPLPKQQRR